MDRLRGRGRMQQCHTESTPRIDGEIFAAENAPQTMA
jgi:hypothetical protein